MVFNSNNQRLEFIEGGAVITTSSKLKAAPSFLKLADQKPIVNV